MHIPIDHTLAVLQVAGIGLKHRMLPLSSAINGTARDDQPGVSAAPVEQDLTETGAGIRLNTVMKRNRMTIQYCQYLDMMVLFVSSGRTCGQQ